NHLCLSFSRSTDLPSSGSLRQNSRYKDGTTKACAIVFLVVPYMALQCDRCLVITTFCNLFAPFHGDDAGSNPAGDANSITYRRTVYSLFNERVENLGSVNLDD